MPNVEALNFPISVKCSRVNVVSWNAMIFAYAPHGPVRKVLLLFDKMKCAGFVQYAIMILALLQACIYSGLREDGICLFSEMEPVYGIKPILEHFTCMVDLSGRVDLLSEAMNLIRNSPYPTLTSSLENFGHCL